MDTTKCLSTYWMYIINGGFMVFGLLLLIVGAIYHYDMQTFDDALNNELDYVMAIPLVIAVGLVLTVVSTFGFLGSIYESKTLLYVVVIFLVILFQMGIGLYVILQFNMIGTEGVIEKIRRRMMILIKGYHDDHYKKAAMDGIQEALKCCGAESYEDYKKLPDSCCAEMVNCTNETVYTIGCAKALFYYSSGQSHQIAVITCGVIMVELMCAAIAMTLLSTLST